MAYDIGTEVRVDGWTVVRPVSVGTINASTASTVSVPDPTPTTGGGSAFPASQRFPVWLA